MRIQVPHEHKLPHRIFHGGLCEKQAWLLNIGFLVEASVRSNPRSLNTTLAIGRRHGFDHAKAILERVIVGVIVGGNNNPQQ